MKLFYYRTRTLLLAFSLLLIAFSARADQLIIEPDMGRAPIINAIQSTEYSIKLVMYGFTDQSLLDAIINQKRNGKTINILLESTPYKAENENEKVIAELNNNHIPWLGHIPPFRLIHQKTLLLDDNKAIVMTFNFTRSTFKNERNFARVIDDPKKVKEITAIFSADWNQVPIHSSAADLIVSPDNSREKLLSLISSAKTSIRIYAQNITDYEIVGELAKAARQGIVVQLLTSSKMSEKQENYLTRAGVAILYSKKLIIHAKIMSFDDQLAMIGSINLTRSSLEDNRELSVLTRDRTVIKQLNATFDNDWKTLGNEDSFFRSIGKRKKSAMFS
jgi:phosphatidylserine/phosphatidylglycerophosphate/cardiolipin synthase-like enzyme